VCAGGLGGVTGACAPGIPVPCVGAATARALADGLAASSTEALAVPVGANAGRAVEGGAVDAGAVAMRAVAEGVLDAAGSP
jgi:hypothetical protein